ncbi:MAG: tyrosine-type recombinase/integrase [Promethearchaeota archaeon]
MSKAQEKTNQELVDTYLSLYESEKSKKIRRISLEKFRTFIKDKPFYRLEYDDFIGYFKHMKSRNLALSSKKTYWAFLKSFIEFLMEYGNCFINFPKKFIKWNGAVNGGKERKNGTIPVEDINAFLEKLKKTSYRVYVLCLLLRDTGMRASEAGSIHLEDVDLEKRMVITGKENGAQKSGIVQYFFSTHCKRELAKWIRFRQTFAKDNKYLFPSWDKKGRMTSVSIASLINKYRKGINDEITSHAFRRTLNTLRMKMGADLYVRKILLNHKLRDVNEAHYTKLSLAEKRALYDKYYPY